MNTDLPSAANPRAFSRIDRLRKLKYYLIVLGLIVLLFLNILDDSDSDAKYQALAVLCLGGVSVVICVYWAHKILQCGANTTDYAKGTTTSRTLLVFWALLIVSTIAANFLGRPQLFVPLTQGMIGTFAGFGSLILTAGPAYKEYKEAIAPHLQTPLPAPVPMRAPVPPAANVAIVRLLAVSASIATVTVFLAARRRATPSARIDTHP
jgi:hypothetical protein